jgi:hypothetical protein
MIDNYNFLITPIDENTHNMLEIHHIVITDLLLIMTLKPTQTNELH